jgi:putative hydrolase of HD superfamily
MTGNRDLLDIILKANELKTIPRMGWRVRGVRDGESVAEHSYAVALIVMLLAPRLSEKIDVSRAVGIALIHDLPEHMLGDIHAPASRLLGETVKEAAELRILGELLGNDQSAGELTALWREFAERSTVEGRFVRAVDKLEMFTQAYLYEQEGNRMLADFWDYDHNVRDFDFPEVRALYEELKELRRERREGWAGRSICPGEA